MPDPFLLLVVFQIGGGVQAVAQIWPPKLAWSAVVSPGAVATGTAPSAGSEAGVWVSAGNPIIVRSRLRPMPFFASNSSGRRRRR